MTVAVMLLCLPTSALAAEQYKTPSICYGKYISHAALYRFELSCATKAGKELTGWRRLRCLGPMAACCLMAAEADPKRTFHFLISMHDVVIISAYLVTECRR